MRSQLIKRYFLTGLLIWVPLVITGWVLSFIVSTLDQSLRLLPQAVHPQTLFGFPIPGAGSVLTLAMILLTGLLANASRTEESRRDAARALVAQCYAQMGQVGMTIDDKSPLAPLMRATLYLRLGDQRLALEALTAHRKLLAAHRAGVKNIVLPRENEKDLADIPKVVLDVLNVYLVDTMDEVLKIALAEPLPPPIVAETAAAATDETAGGEPTMH